MTKMKNMSFKFQCLVLLVFIFCQSVIKLYCLLSTVSNANSRLMSLRLALQPTHLIGYGS